MLHATLAYLLTTDTGAELLPSEPPDAVYRNAERDFLPGPVWNVAAFAGAVVTGLRISGQQGLETRIHLIPPGGGQLDIYPAFIEGIREALDYALRLHLAKASPTGHLRCFRREAEAGQRSLQSLAVAPVEIEQHFASWVGAERAEHGGRRRSCANDRPA